MSNYTPISIIKYFPFQLFGTELSEITSMNNPIPLAIRKLMQQIEQNGQYFSLLLNFLKFSEGLYVTSGASSWDHSEPYKRIVTYAGYISKAHEAFQHLSLEVKASVVSSASQFSAQ